MATILSGPLNILIILHPRTILRTHSKATTPSRFFPLSSQRTINARHGRFLLFRNLATPGSRTRAHDHTTHTKVQRVFSKGKFRVSIRRFPHLGDSPRFDTHTHARFATFPPRTTSAQSPSASQRAHGIPQRSRTPSLRTPSGLFRGFSPSRLPVSSPPGRSRRRTLKTKVIPFSDHLGATGARDLGRLERKEGEIYPAPPCFFCPPLSPLASFALSLCPQARGSPSHAPVVNSLQVRGLEVRVSVPN